MLRFLLLITIAFAFLGCGDGGVETEMSPVMVGAETEMSSEYPCPIEDRGDWVLLVELPRQNLSPYQFRMINEWIDPIMQAYVDGKDFLFVIYRLSRVLPDGRRTDGSIYQARYYLESPGLLHWNIPLQVFHFPDVNAHWFQYWGNPGVQDRKVAGFTVTFDSTPFPNPSVKGVEKPRDYLHFPEFGTSLDGLGVGGPGRPEIREGWILNIYIR